MKIKQKIAVGLASLTLLTSMGTFMSSAASTSVQLYSDQFYAYSASVSGTYKYFWGTNTSSKQQVYYRAQYSNGSSYKTINQYLTQPGEEFGEQRTGDKPNGLWRLELNAYGSVTGATAIGHIRNT